ncbi:hypothetical protein SeLEV6574_g05917 [Synchytrium endobioticum]|uniref:Uncharacterized protein n=1 Tax=Synchytrium endobioticum TaxID=286115 RepID=A0A507CRL6_9FUNG|nr:hypothetical protein SeLEV6574_g05917 [Synchytrium endobioticum]
MVHLVIVGVAALMIFCTSAQAAPTGRPILDLSKALNRLQANRTNAKENDYLSFVARLATSRSPENVLSKKIAEMAATAVPRELNDIFGELFLEPCDWDQDHISIVRAYHSCVFERFKSVFNTISSCVKRYPHLMAARNRLWDFLRLFLTLDMEYRRVTHAYQEKTETVLPTDSGLSYEALGDDEYDKLVWELNQLIMSYIEQAKAKKTKNADRKAHTKAVVESANNDNDANRLCIDFFGNDNDCDQSEHTPVDYLAQSGEQELEFSIGWPYTERGKGATLHIEEPSPLALSYSNWHHPDFSSQSYDKGKGPMYPGGSTDLYPTQHAQGGSGGGSAHSESGSREASEGQIFHKWL